MLYPPGFYHVKKTNRFVILSSYKSSERNLSCFFDIRKPRRIEHLQKEKPFSSDPYFSEICAMQGVGVQGHLKERVLLLLLPKSLLLRQRSRIDEEDEANVKKTESTVL